MSLKHSERDPYKKLVKAFKGIIDRPDSELPPGLSRREELTGESGRLVVFTANGMLARRLLKEHQDNGSKVESLEVRISNQGVTELIVEEFDRTYDIRARTRMLLGIRPHKVVPVRWREPEEHALLLDPRDYSRAFGFVESIYEYGRRKAS